jgi:hypothetical protein
VAVKAPKSRPGGNHLTLSAEETLVGELGTIDLHHCPDSADPPWSQIEVLGTPLTERIKAALAKYGFDQFILRLRRIQRRNAESRVETWRGVFTAYHNILINVSFG